MEHSENRKYDKEKKSRRSSKLTLDDTQRHRSSRHLEGQIEIPYKSSGKTHQSSADRESVKQQYENRRSNNQKLTDKLYGADSHQHVKYLPITSDPMKVYHVDNNIIMFFQSIDDINVANIQIYKADKQILLKQFKYEKNDLLFIDFSCVFCSPGYYIYYTTNYGVFELNCTKIEVQQIYKCDVITRCPVLFGNILYFVQNDLNSRLSIQDVQLVQMNLDTREVIQTIQLHQQRVMDILLDKHSDDLIIVSEQLVDVTETVVKNAPEMKPYQNQKSLCLTVTVYPIQENGQHNFTLSSATQYNKYLLDLPIEKLIQCVLNNDKIFIMYVKNQNHFYCIYLNNDTKNIDILPIQLTQFFGKQVQIKKIIYQDGQFQTFTEGSCYLFKIVKENGVYVIAGIKEYKFNNKNIYSQYIAKKTDGGEVVSQLISKDMNIVFKENEEYAFKRCYTIEDIDFSKAARGNQQKIVYLSVD